MTKKLKMLLSTSLVLSMVMTSSVAFAQSNDVSKPEYSNSSYSIRPFADNYDLNRSISKSNKSAKFTVKYQYAKAFYQNDADAKATVYIQSEDGKIQYDSFSVDANSSHRSDTTMALSEGGTYLYNIIINGGSVDPKGTLIIKSATTAGELD